MVVTLERNGLIQRKPGVPRSIEIIAALQDLPFLQWLEFDPSKSL
jgi:hypothetical protein